MRTRPGLVTALIAALAFTGCTTDERPTSESTASDPVTTDRPTELTDPTVQTSRTETVAPTDPEVVGTIPDDIPLDLDLWDAGADGEYHSTYRPAPEEQRIPLEMCADTVWPLEDPPPVDQLWAWAVGPEYGDRRELVVLPTVDAAVAAVQAFRDALADCEREDHKVWTEHAADTGHDSATFTESYTDGLGLGTYQVTRVGHAVLYTVGYGEGAIRDAVRTVLRRTELTRAIAASLCVDVKAGCGGSETPAPALTIPDDFPLAAGWPRATGEPGYQGLTGPNRTLPPVELAPCDVPADDPEHADRLRAEWADIEDHRSRQLTLYSTELAASEALIPIVENYLSCAKDVDGPSSTTYVLKQTAYGDESWSVAATETYDGGRTSYLGVRHLIRVGRAVLVTVDHNEGGFGPPGSLERNVRRPAAEAEQVLEAMCVFTTAGC